MDGTEQSPPGQMLGVVAESSPGETRVAATPTTVGQLVKLGYDVVVESGAGGKASFSDDAYATAGARIADTATTWRSDAVLKVNPPSPQEIGALSDGATLISLISPASNPALVESLTKRPITVLAMDAVPRISRAQSMDVLSSMANIAGYRAVIEAAHAFGRLFGGQVTAAGKVPPAKVLVAGAGVAGLAAIAAANSLGAVVRATDPRPEVAEQVRSLGGEFLAVEVEQEASTDGYAKATSEDYDRAAAALYAAQAADVDIVITTALIPGRPAPTLLTAEHVAAMKPGSVVVDMATTQGGNVAGSVAGRSVVTDNGVTIIGYTDLAGRLPAQASQLYGTNVVNLLKLLTPNKDGVLTLDLADVVQRTMTVVHNGEKLWPPPPVSVSATPAAPPKQVEPPQAAEAKPKHPARRLIPAALAAVALFAIVGFAPAALTAHFTVFVLAIVIGYYVIGNVHHALHTPLMSVTNAISGIIVVGALLQIGHDHVSVTVLASIAILLASINIFGGFAVTRRMLGMFSRS
ncbi:Re/Si-specific NAD(P)(+) transhydrogenase subunit alpha [Cryptosporangium aurantiacum]|uniref:NAD(P) transhydrogenase subunit alpha n=1 Tax=Cryptosporangium aurantiacum TaxID=134849 RepID=A0A1M7TUZ4_9ACTN|nr:Re/Si-specific NAD(P)(+) transhydrogenase subunit alpha [Cryptosporangium aurantiacum]SHN74423.1 NAD(P) transhydrogenase subunit alpha [Cryptosporangium aurantiacum]